MKKFGIKIKGIVKNGDKTALFDENGITQTGIPDNTIVNNTSEVV
jgi:hypothetical protein